MANQRAKPPQLQRANNSKPKAKVPSA